MIFPLSRSLKDLAMNGCKPNKEKGTASARDTKAEDLIASQIYQGIWEANGEASCTFDLQLKAARKRRTQMEGFNDSIDLGKVA